MNIKERKLNKQLRSDTNFHSSLTNRDAECSAILGSHVFLEPFFGTETVFLLHYTEHIKNFLPCIL